MKRRNFIMHAGAATVLGATTGFTQASQSGRLKSGEIFHTVIFDLKHPVGSAEAKRFLSDGYEILTNIPGVQDFQVFRQCSPKNDYQYGFFMKFKNQEDFDTYSDHPDHNKFVRERWDTEVSHFQESDFQNI